MVLPGDGRVSKCPGRFKLLFMRLFAITLLVWLVFYTVSMTDFNVFPRMDIQSWNVSMYLQNTAYKLQAAIRPLKTPRERKLVLLWTNYFSNSDWLPSTLDLHCPVTECDTTSDHSMLANSSAIILHWRNIANISQLPHCVPSETVHCPPWVLFNKEAPPHTNRDILKSIEDRVHWTATYRKDSDIFAPYGKVLLSKNRNYTGPEYNPNRRLVCWLVSNCNTPSKREVFVSELKEYVEVDTYGGCSDMKCPHEKPSDCYKWLSSRCMFYLSLENSMCQDYVTEKLYNALSTDMVPIVMGNSKNYEHLPPYSYINAADFSSPKELAEYLVKVVKDRRLYMSYFWWKRDYEVRDVSYRWFCDLCERLHNSDVENVKPRGDLVSWWFNHARCTSWQNL